MTWETRDLPVLRAIVDLADVGVRNISMSDIAAHTGLEESSVRRAVAALAAEEPTLFQCIDGGALANHRNVDYVHTPTGHARRVVGTWPTAESLAKKIIQALEEAAEREPDEATRSRLRQASEFFGNTGWTVLLGVAGNAVSKAVGL